MDQKPALDIILPCYNPPLQWASGIIDSLKEIHSLLPGVPITLFIINDGSTEGLKDLDIELLKEKIPELIWIAYKENRGKGFAIREAVSEVKGGVQIYTDIDFPYIAENLVEMYQMLANNNADIVVGTRDHKYYDSLPRLRVIISRSFRFVLKKMLRLVISDTQAGLKGFNAIGREVFMKTRIETYLFDLEFVCLASIARNVRIKGLPVELKEQVQFSQMNLKTLGKEFLNYLSILRRVYL